MPTVYSNVYAPSCDCPAPRVHLMWTTFTLLGLNSRWSGRRSSSRPRSKDGEVKTSGVLPFGCKSGHPSILVPGACDKKSSVASGGFDFCL